MIELCTNLSLVLGVRVTVRCAVSVPIAMARA